MAEILLIRHGKTTGNLEGRYIGSRTDEPLCPEGIRELEEKAYPAPDAIYASPMRRCVETARILWPETGIRLLPGLRECDFGDFEGKNYRELSGDPAYQAWIDSGGTLPFPGGEDPAAFRARCRAAFAQLVRELEGVSRAAVVAHGGTVMAVMERYGHPEKGYFDYQVKNGCGYALTPVEGTERWNCRYLQ
ncbi:MAG: histidine phosphatase family protein [Eubacteriales bacterium]|nr:histidine phosphatase family protein [Eubacteriales bacterium]